MWSSINFKTIKLDQVLLQTVGTSIESNKQTSTTNQGKQTVEDLKKKKRSHIFVVTFNLLDSDKAEEYFRLKETIWKEKQAHIEIEIIIDCKMKKSFMKHTQIKVK